MQPSIRMAAWVRRRENMRRRGALRLSRVGLKRNEQMNRWGESEDPFPEEMGPSVEDAGAGLRGRLDVADSNLAG
jgi:hypothetical protein